MTAALIKPARRMSGQLTHAMPCPWLAMWLVMTPLWVTTVLAKWAPPVGPRDLPMSWPLIVLALLVGWTSGRLGIAPRRLMVLAALMGGLFALQVLRPEGYSMASLMFLGTIFLCYTAVLDNSQVAHVDALRHFAHLTAALAVLAIAQFFLQYLIGPAWAFPVDYGLPDAVRVKGYNNLIPLDYGSPILKANGVFLLEPSFLSQLMAVALIVELCRARSTRSMARMVLYAGALFFSYSGTGLMILATALPVMVIAQQRWRLLTAALLTVAVLVMLREPLNLDIYTSRATEFTSIHSSGFERFVSPWFLFKEFLWDNPWHTLLGRGAGSYLIFEQRAYYPAAEMAWSKVLFEYGVLGSLPIFGFLIWIVLRCPAPAAVRLSVVVMYLMSGLYTPASHGIALSLLVWPQRSGTEPLR